jgi:hypothetical protein
MESLAADIKTNGSNSDVVVYWLHFSQQLLYGSISTQSEAQKGYYGRFYGKSAALSDDASFLRVRAAIRKL